MELPDPFYALGDHIGIDLPGARAVFTTRRGGHSSAPYDTLNLGILTDDDPDAVKRNRSDLEEQFGIRLAWRRQVHENTVHIVDGPNDPDVVPADGDGVATATHGVAPLVLAADCLPIAITDGHAVAMVHAGWPGLAKGVIAAGIAAVHALRQGERGHGGDIDTDPKAEPRAVAIDASDNSRPIVAAIGPGAGPCCYEVGDELRERFAEYGPEVQNGRNLDLKRIAAYQLRSAGVEVVYDVDICTICTDEDLLFSHRRDNGVTGRQAGIAWLS